MKEEVRRVGDARLQQVFEVFVGRVDIALTPVAVRDAMSVAMVQNRFQQCPLPTLLDVIDYARKFVVAEGSLLDAIRAPVNFDCLQVIQRDKQFGRWGHCWMRFHTLSPGGKSLSFEVGSYPILERSLDS